MPHPERYLLFILISLIFSCGIPVDDPNAVTKDQMELELESALLWSLKFQDKLTVYEEALESKSLILISNNLHMYKNAESKLKTVGTELDSYHSIMDIQKKDLVRIKETPSPGQMQTYRERKSELKKTHEVILETELQFHNNLAEGGFRLLTPEDRIREMKEVAFHITTQLVELEKEIVEKRETVASLIGVKERKLKLTKLGNELNEIEELYAKVNVHRNELEKIIRLTSMRLSRVDYYWVGDGFSDQKFDLEFEETVRKTKSQVVELSERINITN